MDFLFAKNEPFNIASIQQDEGGKKGSFYLLLKIWTKNTQK